MPPMFEIFAADISKRAFHPFPFRMAFVALIHGQAWEQLLFTIVQAHGAAALCAGQEIAGGAVQAATRAFFKTPHRDKTAMASSSE